MMKTTNSARARRIGRTEKPVMGSPRDGRVMHSTVTTGSVAPAVGLVFEISRR